ncbi:hypothetical protein [Paraburkholderia sp. J41]|uniref:hypothetical protein n=1 Tax=Paraburkholderia sp. J41 TaxID=2805433 RepID=UPI002AC3710D|nr:hypothetical protein [Paraburkholderia sp. J41]
MNTIFKPVARFLALVGCAAMLAPLAAVAAPYHHEVCHVEHQHHHAVRVCHRVR